MESEVSFLSLRVWVISQICIVYRGEGSFEKLEMFVNSLFSDQFFFTESLSAVCRNQLEEQTA
jgi:hypothetical protein